MRTTRDSGECFIIMPIIIPDEFPVRETLEKVDRISVMNNTRATHQDVREQHWAVMNLMPKEVKVRTVRQIFRLLGHTSLHVQPTLIRPNDPAAESDEELEKFYQPSEKVSHRQFDGLIITGAPLEHLEWKDVRYWDELRRMIDWSRKNVTTRVFICWGAQAALQHNYGIEKNPLPEKAFGVFPHTIENDEHPLVEGCDDEFVVPVSRNTSIPIDAVKKQPQLEILSSSPLTGLHIIADRNGRDIFIQNHPEYGKSTLNTEYLRDKKRIPSNYFPDDNPANKPTNRWRANARATYGNILDHTYQHTPFNIRDIQGLPENIGWGRS